MDGGEGGGGGMGRPMGGGSGGGSLPRLGGAWGAGRGGGPRGTDAVLDAATIGGLPAAGPLTPNSSRLEVFAGVLAEAKRRGYSLDKALAVASTMLQESNGNPRAVDPSGQWVGPFQQDKGYPGRYDPNRNIGAFFDRLDGKGGRTARDIWKTIFWLQQAPGRADAESAYASGRQAYLGEIQSKLPLAHQLYDQLTSHAV